MPANFKTATAAIAGVKISAVLGTSEAAPYTVASGSTFIGRIYVTNVTKESTPASVDAFVSIVKSGGTAASYRVLSDTLTAGKTTVYEVQLDEGDFVSGKASAGASVQVVVSGTEFTNAAGAMLSGIQDDAVGTCNRTASTGTVGSSIIIGTGGNRYLLAALMVANQFAFAAYSTYTTLTCSCTDGAMTRLISADMDPASLGVTGTIHLFGRANPTSGSTQAITANVAKSGLAVDLTLASMALSGVGSVANAAAAAPTTAAALNFPVTSAAGHRPFFAAGLALTPRDLTGARYRAFNQTSSTDFSGTSQVPKNLIFADAPGASTVTIAESVASYLAAVAIDLVPA